VEQAPHRALTGGSDEPAVLRPAGELVA
jgi:hypothetical protein